MDQAPVILDLLGAIADPVVDRAMAAALPTAEPRVRRRISLFLLDRRHPDGLLGVIENFHLLPEDVRPSVLALGGHLDGALRSAVSSAKPVCGANVLSIVHAARAFHMAYLAAELARQAEPQLREQAVECLMELAAGIRSAPGLTRAAAARQVDPVIDQAVARYGAYRSPQILLAYMAMLPRPAPAAKAALSQRRHPAAEPLRQLLGKPAQPQVLAGLINLLGLPAVTEQACAALRRAASSGRLAPVLARSHLLLDAELCEPLHREPDPRSLAPDRGQIERLPASSAAGLPRWLDALSLAFDDRIRGLEALAAHEHPPARLAGLRTLMRLCARKANGPAQEAIARFCLDRDPTIARIAVCHLMRRGWSGLTELLPRLMSAGDLRLRRVVLARMGPAAFDRFWQAWPTLDAPKRLAAGSALIKIDPRFHRHLGGRLGGGDPSDVVRALSIIDTLNQGTFFAEALMRLAVSEDSIVASAAVKALGSASGEQVEAVAAHALRHDDSRVRANAVEALQQMRSMRHVERLAVMARTDQNRPRANAIGALLSLSVSDAVGALHRMLHDPQREHRLSALWLIQTMGLADLASLVAEMSISDADNDVAERAGMVVDRLIETLSAK